MEQRWCRLLYIPLYHLNGTLIWFPQVTRVIFFCPPLFTPRSTFLKNSDTEPRPTAHGEPFLLYLIPLYSYRTAHVWNAGVKNQCNKIQSIEKKCGSPYTHVLRGNNTCGISAVHLSIRYICICMYVEIIDREN